MSAIIDGTNGVTAATLVPSGSSAPTNGIYLPTTNSEIAAKISPQNTSLPLPWHN